MFRLAKKPSKALRQQVSDFLGQKTRILAFSAYEEISVAATQTGLVIFSPNQRMLIAWERILKGGWRIETDELWWELLDGKSGSVKLELADDLLGVFRDCVQASILVQRKIQIPQSGQVVISARRGLSDDAEVFWHALPIGADLADPVVCSLVRQETQRLKLIYGIE